MKILSNKLSHKPLHPLQKSRRFADLSKCIYKTIGVQVRLYGVGALAALLVFSVLSLHAATFYSADYTEAAYGNVGTPSSNGFGSIAHGANGSIYVAGGFDSKVYYSAPGSGTFSPLVNVGNTPLGLALSGNFLYIGVESNQILKVDLSASTPTAVQIGTISASAPQALVIAPTGWGSHGGKLVIGSGSGIFVMDLTTGVSSQLVNTGGPISALAFTPSGELLAANYNENAIYKINPDGTSSVFSASVGSGTDGLATMPLSYNFCTFGNYD